MNFLHHFIGGYTLSWKVFSFYAPNIRNISAVSFVFNRPVPWQLICFLAVLPRPLPISLSGDGAVAASKFADFPS